MTESAVFYLFYASKFPNLSSANNTCGLHGLAATARGARHRLWAPRSAQPMTTAAVARRTSALGRCRPQCSPARRRVLFDVGSNNGAWAAAYLRTHPNAAAFLLEPNPRFEEELRLIETRYDALHVRAAAWIADGNATFHFSRNDESSSLIAGMIRCNARS